MSSAEENIEVFCAVRRQNAEADAVIATNPDFVKCITTRELLERFQDGQIVTPHDAFTDTSELVIRAIHRRARERLRRMIEGPYNAAGVVGNQP